MSRGSTPAAAAVPLCEQFAARESELRNSAVHWRRWYAAVQENSATPLDLNTALEAARVYINGLEGLLGVGLRGESAVPQLSAIPGGKVG